MNLSDPSSSRAETIHVTAPSASGRPAASSGQTMPQRTPFAIQELLGLSESSRPSNPVTSVPPALYSQPQFSSAEHHQMQMAASRMAYFNAHAAVAAAFLPHGGGVAGPLGFTPQGEFELGIILLRLVI